MQRIVKKHWGHEKIIVHTDKYVMKKLFIKSDQHLPKQFHTKKDKTIYVFQVTLLLELSRNENESNVMKLKEGKSWRIIPNTIHRFTAPEDQDIVLYEVSTPELNDVVRLSDDYGRAGA